MLNSVANGKRISSRLRPGPAKEDPLGLDLIYAIEEKVGEVDVFELSRILESFVNVLKESYRVAYPDNGELVVKVKPFEEGSFLMDLALSVQQNPAVLFVLAHPEAIQNAKNVLEFLGFIKKVKDTGTSLLELLRRLKNGRPESLEKMGPNLYEYHANDGSVMPVNSTVHALYNNPIINNYTFNIVAPAARESVKNIRTFLKTDAEASEVQIDKQLADAVRAFGEPRGTERDTEVLEDTTTKILHPKSGNYGGTSGTWIFKIAGTTRSIKARITDEAFLAKYSSGSIRFFQGDILKVRLTERQILEGRKARMEYMIKEVLSYSEASPSPQPRLIAGNAAQE